LLAEKWKVLPKTLKWSNITPEEMRKLLGMMILMGQVINDTVLSLLRQKLRPKSSHL
jgi:hypothetical protein